MVSGMLTEAKTGEEQVGWRLLCRSGRFPCENQWIGEYFVGEDGKWIENFKGGWYKINKKYYYYTPEGEKRLAGSSSENGSIIWIRRKMVRERPAGEGSRISLLFQQKRRVIC